MLITVKAYPAISKKHGECVCIAGIDVERSRWLRLYPVPFRDMPPDKRFRKFDIIEVQARKATDPRPESYEPDADSINVAGHVHASSPEQRIAFIEPLIRPSMCEVRRRQREDRTSLAVFRPAGRPELRIEEDRTPWDPAKQAIVDQPSLLMPGKQGLEKVPYRFLYAYRCQGEALCPGHEQSIVDWEISESFRKWRREHGEAGAIERIRRKWGNELWAPERDTALFVGNQFRNPDGFLVLGVFWPPKTRGAGPAGPAQGELFPRR